ncbi:5-oxoprolinase subunit C family protein [Lunatibacter salilacus]|uniref:5-oxoprolinase subunit C family protein n=1 Tax=Lunatibacter salilacus TaxID=2483804 RepID=UPI00131D395F|nr:biotin-dependent carboxyltransferase family protein [Lunatibacter salilacus]
MRLCKGEISIIKAGPFTSVQDAGRFGYADFGIPTAGFMDAISAGIANLLLGNQACAPCLEVFAGGLALKIDQPCLLVAAGADADIQVGGQVFRTHQPFTLKPGEVLKISPFRSGQWLYFAFTAKFEVPAPFESKSFYFPITSKSRFHDGDKVVMHFSMPEYSPTNCRVGIRDWKLFRSLEVFAGPEFHLLSVYNQETLTHKSFSLSSMQNRLGIQLNEPLEHNLPEILSSPVFPGTVQLTPSGKLIVLMRDAQITGGYPRILQLTETSISLLAQKRPGESVTFSLLPPPKPT